MTFADLLTTLETRAALPTSRVKDLKTSLRYLAHALGQPTLEQCPVGDACRDPATWTTALETHFATRQTQGKPMSAATRRNTRNNLRVVFRLAQAHGLLEKPLPTKLLTKPPRRAFERQQQATSPYRTTYSNHHRRFALPPAEWPPEIREGWRDYQARCGLRLRASTLKSYERCLAMYFGYLTHAGGRQPVWEDLFDVAQLMEFVTWHGARLQRPLSVQGRYVVIVVAAIAKVLAHRHARALADFRNGLQPPTPLHNKRQEWVSLAQLEAVADACLTEGRAPLVKERRAQHSGARRAARFQRGVILHLLVHIPLRQRNVRELQLDKNLYQDQAGHWHLHFRGADLKVGTRGSRVNEYHVDLSVDASDFIPVLEEFLRDYRPRLPGAATSPFLFLTVRGNPFSEHTLYVELATAVALRTGQRFYPHLVRTIWATEFLEDTQDYATAATMLGDTIEVVMKTYYHLDQKEHHAKASAWRDSKRRTG